MEKRFAVGGVLVLLLSACLLVFWIIPDQVQRNVRQWLLAQEIIPAEYAGTITYSLLSNSITFDRIDLPSMLNSLSGHRDDLKVAAESVSLSGLPLGLLLSSKMENMDDAVLPQEIVLKNFTISLGDNLQVSFKKIALLDPSLLGSLEDLLSADNPLGSLMQVLSLGKIVADGVAVSHQTDAGEFKIHMRRLECLDNGVADRFDLNIGNVTIALDDEELKFASHEYKNARLVSINEHNEFDTISLRDISPDIFEKGLAMAFDSGLWEEVKLMGAGEYGPEPVFKIKKVRLYVTSPLDFGLEFVNLTMPSDGKDDFVASLGYDAMLIHASLINKRTGQDGPGIKYVQDIDVSLVQGGQMHMSWAFVVPPGVRLRVGDSAYGLYVPDLSEVQLSGGKIFYKDNSLVDRALLAAGQGDPDEAEFLRSHYAMNLRLAVLDAIGKQLHGESDDRGPISDATAEDYSRVLYGGADFIENPGSIALDINMPQPTDMTTIQTWIKTKPGHMLQYVTSVQVEPGPKPLPPDRDNSTGP